MVFLVIMLGMVHGLVLLSLFGPGSCDSRGSGSSSRSSVSSSSPSSATAVSLRSVHPTNSSCYTINLGFASTAATTDHGRRKPDHFQQLQQQRTRKHTAAVPEFVQHSPDFSPVAFRRSEFDPDRFTFLTRTLVTDEHLVVGGPGARAPAIADPRLTPVPESDEHPVEALPPPQLSKNHLLLKSQADHQYMHKKVCRYGTAIYCAAPFRRFLVSRDSIYSQILFTC